MKAVHGVQGGFGVGTGRGADPRDVRAFRPDALPLLREAVHDLSWLLGRGYAETAALKLVGDRFQLDRRQRMAVRRCAASDAAVADRLRRRRAPDRAGRLLVDAFNVLITLERAVDGGAVLVGREGACRDLAGVHGTWRRVAPTRLALQHLGEALPDVSLHWLIDRPVSNSGRLGALLTHVAAQRGWSWTVERVDQADRRLIDAEACVATSDAGILDRCGCWVSLAGEVIGRRLPDAWLVDLGGARDALRAPTAP